MLGALVAVAVLSVPTNVSAGVINYKFCPSGTCNSVAPGTNPEGNSANDLSDLDHHDFYVWKVGNMNVGDPNALTGAKITFKQMYNWDNTSNKLFLQLYDTAKNSGGTVEDSYNLNGSYNPIDSGTYTSAVRSKEDESSDTGALSDVFNNSPSTAQEGAAAQCAGLSGWDYTSCANKQSSEQTLENSLVSSTTAETFLSSRSFAALGQYPTTSPGQTDSPGSGWSWTADGTYNGKQLYTYTYTFDASELDLLQQYIENGNNIAIGLDPDCHFFNNGVMLTLSSAFVPEPAALLMLGSGLALAVRRRLRRK